MLSNPTIDPLIGSLLDGRYRVVQQLGRGGMGNVYLAEETRLRRRCALKVLHPQLAQDRNSVDRFLREAQMIAQLEHPNIVDIYAYGEEENGVVWFAMELLNGEDLDTRNKARPSRPFSSQDCCAWGVQIARAVAVVHQAGLIHRDLKTSNIFLARRRSGEEIVKLLDFGIARPEEGSELTATGVALGTPSYMSPEQIRNTVVDRRTDIYSFGVLMFKMLTGQLPFAGDAIQMAMAHCLSPVPVPSVVAPWATISPAIDTFVMRAMAKEPGDRYPAMTVIEAELSKILREEAPELVPSLAVGGTTAQSQPTAPTTMSGSGIRNTPDAATASTAHKTGPTAALKPPGHKLLYATTAVSIVSIIAMLTLLITGRKDGLAEGSASSTHTERRADSQSTPPAGYPAATTAATATTATTARPIAASSQPATPSVDIAAAPTSPPKPTEAPPGAPVTAELAQDPTTPPKPPKAQPTIPVLPREPLQQIERKASACRRRLKAIDGPKITIDYAVGIDGKVTRSIASTTDELGKCLSKAVQGTLFEPKLVLGRKLEL